MDNKTRQIVLYIILIFLVAFVIFFFEDITKLIKEKMNNNEEKNIPVKEVVDYQKEAKKIFQDKEIIKKIDNNIFTEEDFLKGFWYESDGNLVFFDPQDLLKKGYTPEQIKKIILNLKKVKFAKKNKMEVVPEKKVPKEIKFYNNLANSSKLLNDNYLDLRKKLEIKRDKNPDELNNLALIYSLQGEYSKSKEMLEKACQADEKYCKTKQVRLVGRVLDKNNKGLSGVKVKLLSSGENGMTDENGEYNFLVSLTKLKKERLIFEKEGYSNNFLGLVLNSDFRKKIKNNTVYLVENDKKYVLDLERNTVDNGGEYEDGKFILKIDNAVYYIPENAFVDSKKQKYNGKVTASLFDFSKGNVPPSMLNLDSFSAGDRNFLGTSMLTLGMSYVVFSDEDGNRIDVLSSNPGIVEIEFEPIKTVMNDEKEMSVEEKDKILKQSEKGEFYYTLERIERLRFNMVPYWILDQGSGVWDNVGYDVIDAEKGKIRSEFYTIN